MNGGDISLGEASPEAANRFLNLSLMMTLFNIEISQ
jgi:hypothetical protein